MMGSYGLNLFTPDAVRESGRPLSLGMLEIKDLISAGPDGVTGMISFQRDFQSTELGVSCENVRNPARS